MTRLAGSRPDLLGRFFEIEGSPHIGRSFGPFGEPEKAYRGLASAAGPVDERQPIEILSERVPGTRSPSFFYHYYNRIYIIPATIDYGAVVQDSRRGFYIWNAYLDSVILTDLDGPGGNHGTDLLGFSGNRALPLGFYPLQLRQFQAVAYTDGEINFEVNYTFTFDSGDRNRLLMFGERARVLPFTPNWRRPYEITINFRTEILVTRSQREQRRALRQKPRLSLSYKTTALRNAVAAFRRHMAEWQVRVVVLPNETEYARISAETPAGNDVAVLDRPAPWAETGATAIIRKPGGEQIITSVAEVSAGAIRFDGIFSEPVPAGSFVMAAHQGRLAASIDTTRATSSVDETDLEFDVSPGTQIRRKARFIEPGGPEGPGTIDYPRLNGRPVFLEPANWKREPKITFAHKRAEVDFDVGRTAIFAETPFARQMIEMGFNSAKPGQIGRVLDLFYACRGRAGEFYLPTWTNDLPIREALVKDTNVVEFPGEDMARVYGDDPMYRAIILMLHSGEIVLNTYEPTRYPVVDNGRSIFTFAEDWYRTIEPTEIRYASFLLVARFASDKLAVEYETRDHARLSATFQTLEDRPYAL